MRKGRAVTSDAQMGRDVNRRIAVEKADVADDHKVRYYPAPTTFFEQLLKGLEENTSVRAARLGMGDFYPLFERVQRIRQYEGVQARMPFELEIK